MVTEQEMLRIIILTIIHQIFLLIGSGDSVMGKKHTHEFSIIIDFHVRVYFPDSFAARFFNVI